MSQENHRTRHRRKHPDRQLKQWAQDNAALIQNPKLVKQLLPDDYAALHELYLEKPQRDFIAKIVPAMTGGAVGVNAAQFISNDPLVMAIGGVSGAIASEQYYKSHTPTQWTGANGLFSYMVMTGNGIAHHDPMIATAGAVFFTGAANRVMNGLRKTTPVDTALSPAEEKKFQSALDHAIYKIGKPAQYPVEFFLATAIIGFSLMGAQGVSQLAQEFNEHGKLAFDETTWRNMTKLGTLPIAYEFSRPLRTHPSIVRQQAQTGEAAIDEAKVAEYLQVLWPEVAQVVQERQQYFTAACAEKPMLRPALWAAAGALMFGAVGQYASGIAALGNSYVMAGFQPDQTGRGR